jgi:hypothetical protein
MVEDFAARWLPGSAGYPLKIEINSRLSPNCFGVLQERADFDHRVEFEISASATRNYPCRSMFNWSNGTQPKQRFRL